MPAVIWWGGSFLLAGIGAKFLGSGVEDAATGIGNGVEDSANGSTRLLLAGAVAGGVYLYARKQGVFK